MQLKLICPSKGRASNMLTAKLLPSGRGLIIVVPFGEGEAYRNENEGFEVIETPKGIRGITPTRQWCLDKWEEVFFIDDDVEKVVKNFTNKGETCSEQEIYNLIEKDEYISRQIGAKMFGYQSIRNPLEYTGHKLYKHTGYWNMSHCGFLAGHNLKFDPIMTEAEDYYISALNVYGNRYGLISKMYSFITKDNFTAEGGCSDYRTQQDLIHNTQRLIDLFGTDIIKVKTPSYTRANINIGERSVTFPF